MAAKQKRMLAAGERAPDFRLTELGGRGVALGDLRERGPVLLAFFKITCPVCQLTLPFLDRLHRTAAGQGFAVYGVSQDDAEDTRAFNSEFGVTFPVLLDPEDEGYPASNAFGISYVPTLFLVERDGSIAWTLEGFHKQPLEELAGRAGVRLFRPGEGVPEHKSG